MSRPARDIVYPVRTAVVLGFLFGGIVLLGARALWLQVITSGYLQEQGNARHLRVIQDNSHRGMIFDRNGEPLAISTPVDSVWAEPQALAEARAQWPALCKTLGLSARELGQALRHYQGREFMYLKRHVTPEQAARVKALEIAGVGLTREYRRYYTSGSVAGHVVGFTNVDDQGLEGVELAYDSWLRAIPGRKRVLKDRYGDIVESVESVTLPVPGKDLTLSLDRRLQYLVYRELKAAVAAHRARGASAIVLDARSGEVLAMVNEPGFNPNNRASMASNLFRNRAVTDVFEPGSTVKPFTVAAALESGRFSPYTPIDTAPGQLVVGRNTIRDTHNYGLLTVAQVLEKSSNVGAARLALALNGQGVRDLFVRAGFGALTGSGLPGEVNGRLNPPSRVAIETATLGYGYGIAVTPLQLARAYAALANDGLLPPVSLLRRDAPPAGERVMSDKNARAVRAMLELAVGRDGTGAAAQVAYYRVGGKTGTAHKLVNGEYANNSYVASFAGFAPASDPRLVMIVTVDEPSGGTYYGGQVAAPVFSKVMAGALRLLDIPPDRLDGPARRTAQLARGGLT
jgi:cell division protein FtsI (penicillin-binding protein 3)